MSLSRAHPIRPLPFLALLFYVLVVVGTGVLHAHDGDAVAGYDRHCLSCHWSHHSPTDLNGVRPVSHTLIPAGILPVCDSRPSKHDTFSKLHGRSPPIPLV